MQWSDLLTAIGLFLILEGIMPFVNPGGWRRILESISQMSEQQLRTVGGCSMAIGLLIVYLVR